MNVFSWLPTKAALLTSLLLIFSLAGCGGGGGNGSSSNGGDTTPPPPPPSKATLSLSPNTGFYQVGDSFNVDIFMNTDGENVVAVAAYIKYDPAYFGANGIDTTESVFPMEAEKIIDSKNGIIRISRGVITPGVNTANGKVASIRVTALSSFSPDADNVFFLFMPASAIRSNLIKDDGLGTPILGAVRNARFAIP